MKMRWLNVLLLLIVVVVACQRPAETPAPGQTAEGELAAGESSGPTEVGQAMPPYKARTLDGGTYDLAEEKGKVILLNIWATWCGPCRHEIPELVKLQNTYAKKGFEVVGVSVDSAEMEGQIAPFVEETGINYPVVLDPRGVIADVFETNILPTSALIDRDGTVVWTHIGMVEADDEQLLSALREVL